MGFLTFYTPMILTKLNHHLQEDHRNFVEDEDAYYGEEIDDDYRDGIVFFLFNYNHCCLYKL
jgi:hypothetical protein